MKQFAIILILLSAAALSHAAKKSTIDDLKQTLVVLQQGRKADQEVATRLKEIELSEQLTAPTRETLQQYAPGPLTVEQLDILEGRSAALVPPHSELPETAAPDVATQKAILAKAVDYVTKVYMQNPHLVALRATIRYQDGVESIHTNSGMTNNMPNVGNAWDPINKIMRLVSSYNDTIETDKGVEFIQPVKQKAPWGQNGQISEGGPGPVLSVILQEAAAAGTLNWRRWQLVRGRPVAVFSFEVPKKKSHYEVHYCCFPVTEDTGRMGYEGTGANLQYNVTWKDFKSVAGYHGEFFVEPDTGAIVRVVTQAELKPTDFVHQEDMRIDYGEVVIAGKPSILPVQSFTLNEVVPNGDNYAARYSVRHTLFHVTYGNYAPAPAK
jgi:hypothetical protein